MSPDLNFGGRRDSLETESIQPYCCGFWNFEVLAPVTEIRDDLPACRRPNNRTLRHAVSEIG